MIKVCVIKFGSGTLEILERLKGRIEVVSICDPDLGGLVLAQVMMPDLEYYADPSKAMQGKCEAVLLTIQDRAPQLALLALAYGKRVIWTFGVTPQEYAWKLAHIAEQAEIVMEVGL